MKRICIAIMAIALIACAGAAPSQTPPRTFGVSVTAQEAVQITDTSGNVLVIAPLAPSVNLATVAGSVKSSAGTLFTFKCVNRNAANRYLQLFNSAIGVPDAGWSATDEFLEPAGGMIVLGDDYFTRGGQSFATGIAFGNSTTSGTYTAATAADHDCSFFFSEMFLRAAHGHDELARLLASNFDL